MPNARHGADARGARHMPGVGLVLVARSGAWYSPTVEVEA